MTISRNLGLYIHIPFCVSKCNYCDFLSFSGASESVQHDYINRLILELDWYAKGFGSAGDSPINVKDFAVDSIFIGGGTPSILPSHLLASILEKVFQLFNVTKDCEITIEANPGTLDANKLKAYRAMGINRLSMGLQSLEKELLAYMGRIHSPEDFIRNYHEARTMGFTNINVDLMFGIPGQTLSTWTHSFQEIMALKPEHISFYGLKIEEGTPFYAMKENRSLTEISDELDREMYGAALNMLTKSSVDAPDLAYTHYELSNASQPGFECRHNLKYWSMDEYLGIGLGAHSYINKERFSVTRDLGVYLERNLTSIAWRHKNTNEDEISEFIFTGMRKIAGLSFSDYELRFGESIRVRFEDQITKLAKAGLIQLTDQGMKLSLKGIDLSNTVLSEFILL